jgi:Immunoglobulin-like domain of bacterial spore germination
MRQAHVRLLAAGGALAVALGVTTAFVIGRDAGPAQPAAVASPTTATTGDNLAQDRNDTTATTQPKPGSGSPVDRESRAAKAAAAAFMRDLGMRDPVAATYRKTGAATAEVGIRPRSGEDLQLDRVTTLVQLHRYTNGWLATGAKAVNTIEVDQPLPFTRIASPVTVSGQSVTYEGTVHVTVTEDRRGADRVLGRSFVNGGGTELAPFSGSIRFATPTPGIDAGWVVFSGDTGADTGIIEATAVRVRFINSDHEPQILGVATSPAAAGQTVRLTGAGTLTVQVRAFGADEVRVLLVPSGTGARPHARLLGVDRGSEGGERWSVSWRYPDESFHGHLLIQVNGRGGTAERDGPSLLHD